MSTKRQEAISGIDSEVEAQLQTRTKRRREERKKRRPKATYDLPLSLIEAIKEIARVEGVAYSDIAAWALAEFVDRYEAGEVDFTNCKRPTRSLRVDWKLELPGKWEES